MICVFRAEELIKKIKKFTRFGLEPTVKKRYNALYREDKKEECCMLSAIDAGKYIVNYSNEIGHPISNLKLQKLLYYTQAAALVELGEPWFEGDITCWRYGPVSIEAYQYFAGYGNRPIESQELNAVVFDREKNKFRHADIEVVEKHKELANKITESYKLINNPYDLVSRTHEESPWKEQNLNEVISNKSIETYFANNKDRLYNKN